MKITALDALVCPACKTALRLSTLVQHEHEIEEGSLTCSNCGRTYPIRGGVPRFVDSGEYASSFGEQWNWFRTVQLDSLNGSRVSAEMLRATTGWDPHVYAGRRLLDAGVGAGRFAEHAAAYGAEVFGVDLTRAIDAAYENIGRRPNVHLVQADIFALPFRPDTFELAYSIGVLHHTPSTARAFGCVADTVAPGGKFAVYLYAGYGIAHRASDALRVVTTKLPLRAMWAASAAAIPLYYVYRIPIVGTVARLLLPMSMHDNWRWRWLDTFDWYTPTFQWKHLYPEVFGWFRERGFRDVQILDGPIRMSGTKSLPTEIERAQFERWSDVVAS